MSKPSPTIANGAFFALATGLTLAAACGGAPDLGAGLPAVPSATAEAPPAAPTTPPPTQTAAAAPKKATAAECEAWKHHAQEELDAEHIKVDKPCKKTADCILVRLHACEFSCDDAAIPKAEEAEWLREMKEVKDGPCKKWADNECATTAASPAATCEKKAMACVKERCVLK